MLASLAATETHQERPGVSISVDPRARGPPVELRRRRTGTMPASVPGLARATTGNRQLGERAAGA